MLPVTLPVTTRYTHTLRLSIPKLRPKAEFKIGVGAFLEADWERCPFDGCPSVR